jgi:opacity protein-like surface antigen
MKSAHGLKFLSAMGLAWALVAAFGADAEAADFTTNVTFSPIGLLLGAAEVSADYAISDSWTVGPDLFLWDLSIDGDSVQAYGAGLHARYYIGHPALTTGWQVKGQLSYASVDLKETDDFGDQYEGKKSGFGGGVIGAYQWFWSSGFNMSVGLGLGASQLQDLTVTDANGNQKTENSHTETGLQSEFTLGWAF